jgi:hypothetical protein
MPLELTESPDECADGTCRLPGLASHRPGVFSPSHRFHQTRLLGLAATNAVNIAGIHPCVELAAANWVA